MSFLFGGQCEVMGEYGACISIITKGRARRLVFDKCQVFLQEGAKDPSPKA